MDLHSPQFVIWAVVLGGISAASLPLGSLVGIWVKPRPALISSLAAFGAGALIAALAVELVAPTVMAIGSEPLHSSHGDPVRDFYGLILGAFAGGILYVVLDQLVNARGGFFRKKATLMAHFHFSETKRKRKLVEQLSRFPILYHLQPGHIETLVSRLHPVAFTGKETVARQGTDIAHLYFIVKGSMKVTRDGIELVEMKPGEVVGIIPLLSNIPAPATVTAKEHGSGFLLTKPDFNRLREISPEFNNACKMLAERNLETLEGHIKAQAEAASEWKKSALHAIEEGVSVPTLHHMHKEKEEHQGAALAIWLGILLDGIPESLVIGGGVLVSLKVHESMGVDLQFINIIPFTLIAGLFLSNFPEALSSSASMKNMHWKNGKIFLMWFSLMVITAIGAGLGFVLTETMSHTGLVFLEGLASGAMLTMIAAAMIPESVHLGKANVAGISTLVGFLAAVAFKLFE